MIFNHEFMNLVTISQMCYVKFTVCNSYNSLRLIPYFNSGLVSNFLGAF